jgi:hypothetical protein
MFMSKGYKVTHWNVTGSPTEMYSGAGHASQGGGHSGQYDVQKERKNSKNN